LPNRINKEGEIILTSEKHRLQELNIDDAFNRLQEWINDASLINIYRKKTRPPEHAIERRLRQKKIRSEIKSRRQRRDD
jgi:ribosome-associated protein